MIKLPPKVPERVFVLIGQEPHLQHLSDYMKLSQPTDSRGRYLHFDTPPFSSALGSSDMLGDRKVRALPSVSENSARRYA